MKLNVYTSSHPIILYLSSITREKYLSNDLKKYRWRQLGVFLIYESLRNWLQTHLITIKTIEYTKNITILDNQEQYHIITNNNRFLCCIQETEYIIHKCNIQIISEDQITISNNYKNIKDNSYNNKIIIVLPISEPSYILKLIQYLIRDIKLQIEQIRLVCVYCYNDHLITISQRHPRLTIYTTEINQLL